MKKTDIHVLSLSYAQELFLEKEQALGDTLIRSIAYSEQIASYTIIIHTLRKNRFTPKHLAPDFLILPSNGRSRFHSLLKMYAMADKICSQHPITLIQSQEPVFTGLLSLILKRKHAIPVNVLLYGGNVYDPLWKKQRLLNSISSLLGKYVLNHADSIQVEGTLIKQSLISHAMPASKIFVKPMVPHNLEIFSKAAGSGVREQLLQNKFEHIILFVGRLIKEKNLAHFLEVFKIVLQTHPATLLVIIGDGDQATALQKLAHRLFINKNITWFPHVAHDTLPHYYKAADIFTLFSVSEGFPRVLMEAAAAGIPIVCSRISGSTDAVDDGQTGFIIPINNMRECADKIILLLNDSSLRAKMGNAAPLFIKHIGSFQDNIKKQIDIWQQISK
ncbi:MAG: hypothetical protein A2Y62_21325 [Candidatus Fischerbacteria bacterium RBG_13_37_8]|uniref:Glycosyl transferase family 1 domain-containing protein n=1 Tax=Candidatus Fischerbacteria bacterium RBG_13_37_8 TaxID=1817863 RepID=A0A1F5VP36_9BACT|nr:MAG: hypothetical protein A2Y62_21325 [Candidatus Fischerbacteria bacterium RBG_13_37_8]